MYTIVPISELIKNGWIQAADSIDELEQQACNYLGISSLDETPQLAVNFRCSEHDYYDCTLKNDGNSIHPFDCTKFITCHKACHYIYLDTQQDKT